MTSIDLPPLVVALALTPVLALAAGALVAAVRWDPPAHRLDPVWTVLGVLTTVLCGATAVWLALSGGLPLVVPAVAGAVAGLAATVWLDRGAAAREGDSPEWVAFEDAFRAYTDRRRTAT